jgi:hypothetical protein
MNLILLMPQVITSVPPFTETPIDRSLPPPRNPWIRQLDPYNTVEIKDMLFIITSQPRTYGLIKNARKQHSEEMYYLVGAQL